MRLLNIAPIDNLLSPFIRKLEVEKKGSDLSVEQALKTLNLQMNGELVPEEKFVRKAYFKLASKLDLFSYIFILVISHIHFSNITYSF